MRVRSDQIVSGAEGVVMTFQLHTFTDLSPRLVEQ
jgi:hypothetical protein